jgi:uncharacterized membrane protein YeaQ/YmgE (transglycosylase-associated protein family)
MPELLVSWIVIGLVVGILVWLFSPRHLSGGLFTNLVVGIVAAAVAGFVIAWLTGTDVMEDKLTWGILTVTALAAVITLAAVQIQGRPRDTVN